MFFYKSRHFFFKCTFMILALSIYFYCRSHSLNVHSMAFHFVQLSANALFSFPCKMQTISCTRFTLHKIFLYWCCLSLSSLSFSFSPFFLIFSFFSLSFSLYLSLLALTFSFYHYVFLILSLCLSFSFSLFFSLYLSLYIFLFIYSFLFLLRYFLIFHCLALFSFSFFSKIPKQTAWVCRLDQYPPITLNLFSLCN